MAADEGVYYDDGDSGVAGTDYPVGTAAYPVNNFTDLYAILTARDLRTIYAAGSLQLTGPMTSYNFVGRGGGGLAHGGSPRVDINGQSVNWSTFENLTLLGPHGGNEIFYCIGCRLTENWGGIAGSFIRCMFTDSYEYTLLAGARAYFWECKFEDDSVITLNGGDAYLMRCAATYDFWIEGSPSVECWIDLNGGRLRLTTASGDFFLMGEFMLEDWHGGTSRVFDLRASKVAGEVRPRLSFVEDWGGEAGIDTDIWTPTNPATGTAWGRLVRNDWIVARTAPNADETARLVSTRRWPMLADRTALTGIFYKLVIEWEMELDNVANVDNTLAFFGLMTNVGDNRGSQNLIGLGLSTDLWQAVSDEGGAEYTGTAQGVPALVHAFRIELTPHGIYWFIDQVAVGFTEDPAKIPGGPAYINFFIDTEGGGPAAFYLGPVRVWAEDYVLSPLHYSG